MTDGNSRRITGAQPAPHPDLARVVRRHLAHRWRRPIADHTQAAFAATSTQLASLGWQPGNSTPLLLDSGCGTGASTAALAKLHPDAVVLGLDKSAARLQAAPALPDNALLVRAEAADFCRLALAAGWQPTEHWLLYPNPWPKPGHLQRRWHGHPVFPSLLALGGRITLRTNWQVYAQEFTAALALAGQPATCTALSTPQGLSPFERKYHASGHSLWQVVNAA